MKILAFELSSPQGSIAWQETGAEPFSRSFQNDRKHSGLFFENVELCLKRFGNPDRLVIGLGPGSYAGTRIAIATATGLAAINRSELIGIPSLCAMETEAKQYAVIGDARRGSYYFAHVRDRRCVEGPLLRTEGELKDHLMNFADPVYATEPLPVFPDVTVNYPAAVLLTQIAATTPPPADALPLEPLYLREPNITYPKNRTQGTP